MSIFFFREKHIPQHCWNLCCRNQGKWLTLINNMGIILSIIKYWEGDYRMNFTQEQAQERYEGAKAAMRSGSQEGIAEARECFLELGDFKNSAAMADKCDMLLQFQVGNTVTFGQYGGKPIRWRVVDTSGKMKMLLAEEIVLEKPYNELRVDTYWQHATLRKWLNKEFLQEAFTQEQRMMVMATRRTNEPNECFYTNAGLPTMDKVFVLSKRELDQYLPERKDRAFGKWWWLRTPGDNLLAVTAVDEQGEAYLHGVNVNYITGGVRPALWILLKDY